MKATLDKKECRRAKIKSSTPFPSFACTLTTQLDLVPIKIRVDQLDLSL
jgi:hypothetical protein